jgi:hypothetical protein
MGKTVWKDSFVIKAYELAKSGMIERKIARALGISFDTFTNYEKKKPLFKAAVKQGRLAYRKKDNSTYSFRDYVHGRLSEEAKEVWCKIIRCDSLQNGTERLEAILSERGVRIRQQLFVYAYISSNFSISAALRRVNISRSAFELWKKDPEFLKLFEELGEIKGDFFEEHLCMLVASGDSSSTIFANRTFNRKRGYNEKVDVDVNVSGQINHNIIPIDSLGLSLKERKKLLNKVRKVKQIESKAV